MLDKAEYSAFEFTLNFLYRIASYRLAIVRVLTHRYCVCVVANGEGYCADDVPTVADIFNTADEVDIPYQLRIRPHNMSLINKTKFLNGADFIIRMIYSY